MKDSFFDKLPTIMLWACMLITPVIVVSVALIMSRLSTNIGNGAACEDMLSHKEKDIKLALQQEMYSPELYPARSGALRYLGVRERGSTGRLRSSLDIATDAIRALRKISDQDLRLSIENAWIGPPDMWPEDWRRINSACMDGPG